MKCSNNLKHPQYGVPLTRSQISNLKRGSYVIVIDKKYENSIFIDKIVNKGRGKHFAINVYATEGKEAPKAFCKTPYLNEASATKYNYVYKISKKDVFLELL